MGKYNRQILSLLVFSLESPGDPGPIYCQHHFPWEDNRQKNLVSVGTSILSVNCSRNTHHSSVQSSFWYKFVYHYSIYMFHYRRLMMATVFHIFGRVTDVVISPSVRNEKLHSLFNSGSERILTGQQQQQLCRGQLQQHACDFTGKRLRRQTHSWSKCSQGNILNSNKKSFNSMQTPEWACQCASKYCTNLLIIK